MYSWVKFSHLVKWTGGKCFRPSDALPVTVISSDSRTIKPGDIFVALKGESFDGHDYLEDVVKKGASALIVSRPFDSSVPVLLVSDTLRALAAIGRELRTAFKGPVFAVTGSAGKSSTKEALATALGTRTLASPASFNNLLGVSKTLFLVMDDMERMILEMGMNAPGEIREMCEHFVPTGGLITNIGDAHIGMMGGKEGIFRAKKELFDFLASHGGRTGVAVNIDDPMVVRAFDETVKGKTPSLRYSMRPDADAEIKVLERGMDEKTGYLSLTLSIQGEKAKWKLPIYGLHFAQNIAAAAAAATLLGVRPNEIAERMTHFQPASHRGHIHHLSQERILIDESYNSNPSALAASLESCAQFEKNRRRVFVLGEMRELGEFSEKLHAEAGSRFARLFSDTPFLLIGVGEATKNLLRRAKEEGCPESALLFAPDSAAASDLARQAFQPGALCLVKGSRGIKLDRVVEILTKI